MYIFSVFLVIADVNRKLLKMSWCVVVAVTVAVTPHVYVIKFINNLTITIFIVFFIHITWQVIMGSF